jgi:hypothetical protein
MAATPRAPGPTLPHSSLWRLLSPVLARGARLPALQALHANVKSYWQGPTMMPGIAMREDKTTGAHAKAKPTTSGRASAGTAAAGSLLLPGEAVQEGGPRPLPVVRRGSSPCEEHLEGGSTVHSGQCL